MRLIPLWIFLGLATLMGVGLVMQNMPKPQGASVASTSLPALPLTPLIGTKPWKQSDLQGRVTLINFFASWCVPCLAENPELIALKKQFPALHMEGVVWNDTATNMKKWLKKNGNPYHNVWQDPKGEGVMALGMRGIPESYLINAKGQVRYHLAGPLTKGEREGEFGALVTQLLKEAPDAK